jgi:hypothetical protein
MSATISRARRSAATKPTTARVTKATKPDKPAIKAKPINKASSDLTPSELVVAAFERFNAAYSRMLRTRTDAGQEAASARMDSEEAELIRLIRLASPRGGEPDKACGFMAADGRTFVAMADRNYVSMEHWYSGTGLLFYVA